MAYISASQYNLFAGTSGQDALIDELIASAEASLNSVLRITTLDFATYDEFHDNKSIGPYYLNELNAVSIEKINDAVFSTQYLLEGRRLQFKSGFIDFDDWSRIKINYTAGYVRGATPGDANDKLPQDIRTIMYYLVTGLMNERKGVGISEWSQGQLRIKYGTTAEMSTFKTLFTQILSKYKKNDIYS